MEAIEEFFKYFSPLENSLSWDNVGLLIPGSSDISNILLTIDLTEEVLNEAIQKNIKFIIAYHPVIFKPLKNFNEHEVVVECIRNNISVFCVHTALDRKINEYLLGKILSADIEDIIHLDKLNIGSNGISTYTEKPEIFFKDMFTYAKNNTKSIKDILLIMKKMFGTFRYSMGIRDIYDSIKNKIVVAVGSPGLEPLEKDSILITGEMSHHNLLFYRRKNVTVILTEHSKGERIYLPELKQKLELYLPGSDIYISEFDKDPVNFLH
ncbi:NGG1p interacting factor 3, partial [Spraguea lophii 42_110]